MRSHFWVEMTEWTASPSCFQKTRCPEFCLTLISRARKPLKKPHWFRDSLKGFVSTLTHTHVYSRVDSNSQLSPLNIWIRSHQRAIRERCLLRNFASSWRCAYHKGGLHDCKLEGWQEDNIGGMLTGIRQHTVKWKLHTFRKDKFLALVILCVLAPPHRKKSLA